MNDINTIIQDLKNKNILDVLNIDEQKAILRLPKYYKSTISGEDSRHRRVVRKYDLRSTESGFLLPEILDIMKTPSYIKDYILYHYAVLSYHDQVNSVEGLRGTFEVLKELITKEILYNDLSQENLFKIRFLVDCLLIACKTVDSPERDYEMELLELYQQYRGIIKNKGRNSFETIKELYNDVRQQVLNILCGNKQNENKQFLCAFNVDTIKTLLLSHLDEYYQTSKKPLDRSFNALIGENTAQLLSERGHYSLGKWLYFHRNAELLQMPELLQIPYNQPRATQQSSQNAHTNKIVQDISKNDILSVLTVDEQKKILALPSHYSRGVKKGITATVAAYNPYTLKRDNLLSKILDKLEEPLFIRRYILHHSATLSSHEHIDDIDGVIKTLEAVSKHITKEKQYNNMQEIYNLERINFTVRYISVLLQTNDKPTIDYSEKVARIYNKVHLSKAKYTACGIKMPMNEPDPEIMQLISEHKINKDKLLPSIDKEKLSSYLLNKVVNYYEMPKQQYCAEDAEFMDSISKESAQKITEAFSDKNQQYLAKWLNCHRNIQSSKQPIGFQEPLTSQYRSGRSQSAADDAVESAATQAFPSLSISKKMKEDKNKSSFDDNPNTTMKESSSLPLKKRHIRNVV